MANNPINVANDVLANLTLNQQMPDYVASFGTGTFDFDINHHVEATKCGHYFVRVWDLFQQQIDPEQIWFKGVSHMNSQLGQRYIRINPTFPCQAVSLDDASAIPDLKSMTKFALKEPEFMIETETTLNIHNLKFKTPEIDKQTATFNSNTRAKIKILQLKIIASCFYPTLLSSPKYIKESNQYKMRWAVVLRW